MRVTGKVGKQHFQMDQYPGGFPLNDKAVRILQTLFWVAAALGILWVIA